MKVVPANEVQKRRTIQEVFPALTRLDIRRMNEELEDKLPLFDPSPSLSSPRKLHPSWYINPLFNKAITLAVFLWNEWVAVTNTAQFRNPTSSVELKVAEGQVSISLDEENNLTALRGICAHDAHILDCDKQGNRHCEYHGADYRRDGNMFRFRGFGGGGKYSKADLSLPQFEIDTWGPKEAPIVFVRMEPNDDSLETTLRPLTEVLKDRDLSSLRWHSRQPYEINCNWMLFVNNYKDGGFHLDTIHPELAKGLECSEYRTSFLDDTVCKQECPTKAGDGVTAALRKGKNAKYVGAFPGFMFDSYEKDTGEKAADTMMVFPLDTARCRVDLDFYFSPNCSEKFINEFIASSSLIQDQDIRPCESVQRNLSDPRAPIAPPYGVTEISAQRNWHRRLYNKLTEFNEWLKEGLKEAS